jgi:phytoene dehydrogenase-like protein
MQRIGNKHNVKIHLNSPVVRITTNGKKATGVVLHDGTAVQADVVVSNADLEFTESHLLDAKDQSYSEAYWQKRQPGQAHCSYRLAFVAACQSCSITTCIL